MTLLIHRFYQDCWKPTLTRTVKLKTAQDFYDALRKSFAADRNVNPMGLNQAVTTMFASNVSAGELEKLRAIFPPHLREIWPKDGMVGGPFRLRLKGPANLQPCRRAL